MYLARVLVGEYTVGRTGLLTPPPKDQDLTDTFDSVVDQIPNPEIFVAFYDWQCYPGQNQPRYPHKCGDKYKCARVLIF